MSFLVACIPIRADSGQLMQQPISQNSRGHHHRQPGGAFDIGDDLHQSTCVFSFFLDKVGVLAHGQINEMYACIGHSLRDVEDLRRALSVSLQRIIRPSVMAKTAVVPAVRAEIKKTVQENPVAKMPVSNGAGGLKKCGSRRSFP